MNVRHILLYIFLKRVIRKTDRSNCRSISLLSDFLEKLSRMTLSRLTPYVDLTVNHKRIFQTNKPNH